MTPVQEVIKLLRLEQRRKKIESVLYEKLDSAVDALLWQQQRIKELESQIDALKRAWKP